MVHPWKGCVEQSTVGSNPILSAIQNRNPLYGGFCFVGKDWLELYITAALAAYRGLATKTWRFELKIC